MAHCSSWALARGCTASAAAPPRPRPAARGLRCPPPPPAPAAPAARCTRRLKRGQAMVVADVVGGRAGHRTRTHRPVGTWLHGEYRHFGTEPMSSETRRGEKRQSQQSIVWKHKARLIRHVVWFHRVFRHVAALAVGVVRPGCAQFPIRTCRTRECFVRKYCARPVPPPLPPHSQSLPDTGCQAATERQLSQPY